MGGLALGIVACGDDDDSGPSTTTDRIIETWAEAWMDGNVDGVVDLYAANGTYSDTGCPFEVNGKAAIRRMVTNNLGPTTYTIADPVEIRYTESGAVVQWIWGGTYQGEEFEMELSTTFEFEGGLIVRSTDSYERSDAPWEQACIELSAG